MNANRAKNYLASGLILLATGWLATSCMDDSYDLSKDIDLTMGLGSEGLAVKLGSTEKVYLEDVLEVDASVKTDQNNLYYLVESGNTSVDFHVNSVRTHVDNAALNTNKRVVDFVGMYESITGTSFDETIGLTSVNVPAGFEVASNAAGETPDFKLTINHIEPDVVAVTRIWPVANTHIRLAIKPVLSSNMKMKVAYIKNLRITMPEYLEIQSVNYGSVEDGNTIYIDNVPNVGSGMIEICDVTVASLNLDEDGKIENGTLTVSDERSQINMSGEFGFASTSAFTMGLNDYADVQLQIGIGTGVVGTQSEVEIDKVTGKFDPSIDPNLEKIDIAESLPDFLQDKEVVVDVANPTLKLHANMVQIPMALNFSGELKAVKANATGFPKTVKLPSQGTVELNATNDNWLYFSQQDTPYDPETVVAGAQKVKVSNLSTLIETLPDYIEVNVGDKKIRVPQDRDFTLQLGRDYHADLDYDIYVPFTFNNELKIVYRDSTNSMNDDLKDYQAKGLKVTADVVTTIPLALTATAVPVDINGNELTGIHVKSVKVPAAEEAGKESTCQVELDILLDNPADLQKVDRLTFHVNANATQEAAGTPLNSKQYLQFNNLRLFLKGQVVGDFN